MANNEHSSLTTRDNLLFGAGSLALNLYGLIVLAWVLTLYQGNADLGLPRLVPAGLFAAIFAAGRVFDAIVDPLVGFASDRVRSRWGRRKPLILAGLLPQAAFFCLLWHPPRLAETAGNGWYLLAVLCGFFGSFAVVFAPYLAMMPELSRTDHERNTLATTQAVFGIIGTLVGSFYGLLLQSLSGGGRTPTLAGFQSAGLIVAFLGLVSASLPLLTRRAPIVPQNETHLSLIAGLRATLASRPFRHYIAAFLLVWMALQLVLAAMPQMPIARLGATPAQNGLWASLLQASALIGGALCFPLLMRLMESHGRAWTWSRAMAWFAVIVPLLAVPRSLPTMILLLLAAGPAVAGLMILPHALLADICDHDARLTGQRREALFYGVQGTFTKAAMACSVIIASGLLDRLGNTAARPWGLVACPLVASLATAGSLLSFRGFRRSMQQEASGGR
ncbi:MAG: MFS transporter [Armatimonadetes bacterium]|nr:MFS transporter [Armatimonadota bacterium]